MIELRVSLRPQKAEPISRDYIAQLKNTCESYISKYQMGSSMGKNVKTPIDEKDIEDNDEDYTFSNFRSADYVIKGKDIIFNTDITWKIKSTSYEIITILVQGLFRAKFIKIDEAVFEINGIETIKRT